MKTNEFSVKEKKGNKIVLEEENDKKHGIIWIFFYKYGRMLNMILALVALFVFLIDLSLSYDIFMENAKRVYVIDEREYFKYNASDLKLDDVEPISVSSLDDLTENVILFNNDSRTSRVEFLVVISEVIKDSMVRLNPSELMFSVSTDGGNSYSNPSILNSNINSDLTKLDYVIYKGTIDHSSSMNLKLKIWLPETGLDQNHLQGKIFRGKINVYYRVV